ncbi:XkdW family protein [Psychrobacillus sp. FSL K6-4615]|uniref:XkdW family protein n=1 Tax=Psychrobacillus sp. FSL K6-4615 TaxID=2921551 RepID=UPI0030F92E21
MEWVTTEDEYGIYKTRTNELGITETVTEYKQKYWDENPPQEPEPKPPSETDILAEELVKMKFENMQKDNVISTFGEEITKLKLEMMILKGGA